MCLSGTLSLYTTTTLMRGVCVNNLPRVILPVNDSSSSISDKVVFAVGLMTGLDDTWQGFSVG